MKEKAVVLPEDYNDFSYRFTYWLLGKFAHKVPNRITPNQITITAFLSAMIGTVILFFDHSPSAYLYWVVFNFAWYFLDALDGIHARLSGQSSEFGAFLDHALDNIYFIFMFTAFAYRFDLHTPLYIFILLSRVTAAVIVFLVSLHTGRNYIPKFSAGLELLLLTAVMLLSYCFPHFQLNLDSLQLSHFWQGILQALDLKHGVFMKLVLLFYGVGVPIAMVYQFRFVKRHAK